MAYYARMNHRDVIRLLGGPTAVALKLNTTKERALHWSRRNRIASEFWHRVEDLAASEGHPEVTCDLLAATVPADASEAA